MLVFKFGIFSLLVLSSHLIIVSGNGSGYTLKSLNVIFRHGDRTPTGYPDEYYPNDPYNNETYYEQLGGYGMLTNKGKFREYRLGKSLRKHYDEFLGQTYYPVEVKARSTNYPRTKMSTELVLAGLFPPRGAQVWKNYTDWQPIPVLSAPSRFDPFFKPFACPMYKEELARVKSSEAIYKNQFNQIMSELTKITGKQIKSVRDVWFLYHLLVAEKSLKFKLPEWTKKYFPNGLVRDAAIFEYEFMSYTKSLKTFSGGLPLKKILKNMKIITELNEAKKPKIFLYGGHEDNIAGLLISLNVWRKKVPEYSSAIIFELHQKDSNYYVKLQYYKGKPSEFENLILPNCEEFCPIERFIEITKEIIPENSMETCYGPYTNSKLIPSNENPVKWLYEEFEKIFDF